MIMLGDEPPYLSVGTEVSAKYKGAFCEAKVRKVDRVVKCKIAFKLGFGSHTVLDNQVRGVLRVGATVEARHPEKKELVEGTITKIQDCSQYTVVFDDGDITTLRRSALCLKSGRHFAESETLDQLPLTHPEHFGNPVVGGRRGGRRRLGDESSGDEESPRKGKPPAERETEIGKVVCVELGDKKKVKDNWFPGLVVAPTAQDTVRIRVKEEYLVRSFKDGRYYTVPKKEATEFTREIGQKVDNNTLKTAVEKALTFLDKDELPPHWDRELLFGLLDSDDCDSDAATDSDSSDDEPREEKDHFVAQLYKFMDDRGTPINNCPSIGSHDLDLYKLFKVVNNMNGYNRVSNQNQWKIVSSKLGLGTSPGVVTQMKHAYKKYLHSFEDFYRKLGCTMVSHPRNIRSRMKGGRALIRDKDRATPVNLKTEAGSTPKREEEKDLIIEESASVTDSKKSIKEDESKSKVKVEEPKEVKLKQIEVKEELPSDPEPARPASSLRKKCPAPKTPAPARIKEDAPLVPTPSKRPNQRPKRAVRDSSVDDGRTSGDENRNNKPVEDQQRSTTRSKAKEEPKPLAKKESVEIPKAKPASIKAIEIETPKKSKPIVEEVKKGKEVEKKVKKGVVEECVSSTVLPTANNTTKRNRKRRNTEIAEEEAKTRPCIPRSRSVFVGDVVKVYYGSNADPNGIYEAKVVDIDNDESGEQMFLVHYAGWNSRYDEWVKRAKIAENLSRIVRRAKNSPVKNVKAPSAKKKVIGNSGNKAEPARSTTPSSITSSSSRTKSPATPASLTRLSKRRERPNTPSVSTNRRTRRISGHTDVSLDTDSESESVDSASDSDVKADKATSDAASVSDDNRKKEPKKVEVKTPIRRKAIKKTFDDNISNDVVEKKKPRLMRANSLKVEKEKETKEESKEIPEVKHENVDEPEVKTEISDGETPKGRDFDLNEIRSELKGIDKAVKVSSESQESTAVAISNPLDVRFDMEVDDVPVKVKNEEPEATATQVDKDTEEMEEDEVLSVEEEKPPTLKLPVQSIEDKDQVDVVEDKDEEDVKEDIYEFKEPEPFEFQEVRRPIRIFDEPIERSPEKSLNVKKASVPNVNLRAIYDKVEKRDVNSLEMDVKIRFRKTIGKKMNIAEKREVATDSKEDEIQSKEAPKLEVEEPPPSLTIAPEVELEEPYDDESTNFMRPHKSSPEPPCLIPVTETVPCRPPEHSPILIREDPPRLDSDISSSDSESEERLVIVNEEESTSSDLKIESQPLPPPPPPLPQPVSPPVLLVEEPILHNRSPSPETSLNQAGDNENSPLPLEPQSPKRVPTPELPPEEVKEDAEEDEEEEEEDDDEEEEEEEEEEEAKEDEGSMRSLLCDEVFPGSPAPKEPSEDLGYPAPSGSGGNAAAVMENTPPTTPPTTPESNVSSPREDRVGSSSLDNESSKSHRDSSEVDMENEGQKNRSVKYSKRCEKEPPDSPSKKKRRSRKRSESTSEIVKRSVCRGSGIGSRAKVREARDASDSDDTSENSLGIHTNDPLLSSRSPRPSKYNFCKEIAPDLDANQRITFLQNQLQELRKAYINVKSQLASIDRRRKKLRRKEREEKAEKAAAAAKTQDPSYIKD